MKPSINVDSLETLEKACHELIPVSVAMGVRMDSYDGSSLQVSAPLTTNINHQLTAFGGSLYALAAVAGWGLLQLKLGERSLDGDIVIVNAEANYYKPVTTDLVCRCALPADADDLLDVLERDGKVKTSLKASYQTEDGTEAMSVVGKYHIRLRQS